MPGNVFLRLTCLAIGLLLIACDPDLPDPNTEGALPVLYITVKPEYLTLLKRKRAQALREGFLANKAKDYVPARVQYEQIAMDGEVRLKGDWLDHLKGKKWSLRIKLENGHPALAMRSFSVQHPRTRSYLDEWVFHRLLNKVGILTPRYSFVQLVLNDRPKGIFALEEHFEKRLPEQAGRRESPILKFNESGFWEIQRHRLRSGTELGYYLPEFEAAEIEAFQKGHTLRDSSLHQLFEAGRAKMEQYRRGDPAIDRYLAIEQMAKLYALADICKAYHALRWHNLRFYYNPISARLEPVVFDSFARGGVYKWFSKPYLGFHDERQGKVYFAEDYLIFYLFNHPEFRQLYHRYLQEYSASSFMREFLQEQEPELQYLQTALQTEFPNYRFEADSLLAGAQHIQDQLVQFDTLTPPFVYTIYESLYDSCHAPYPFPSIALKAWKVKEKTNTLRETIQVRNYYCRDLAIVASGPKKSKPIHPIDPPRQLLPFDVYEQPPKMTSFSIPAGDRYLFFEEKGRKDLYHQKISGWPVPSPPLLLSDDQLQIDSSIFVPDGDTIRVAAGQYRLDQMVTIPKYRPLVIDAGAAIDMVNGAACLIFGPLKMIGRKEKPIRIYSSDLTSRGWQVIGEAGAFVRMMHVNFDALGSLEGPDRWLTGGLSIYKAKIYLQNIQITNSQSEDALNIISSSNFDLQEVQFRNCYADALDVDFSQGRIRQCSFEDIKGDAVDLSASQVVLRDLQIRSVGDKGISIGEGSEVQLVNAMIADARIAIATKDASRMQCDSTSLQNSEYGLAIFNKKTEYGPASVDARQIHFENIKQNYLLEAKQHFLLNDQDQAATDSAATVLPLLYPDLEK